jgi:small subunit ribosomal protein S1
MATATAVSMEALLKDSPVMIIPHPGELIEGKVIDVTKHRILVDLGGVNTGIISGRETKDSVDTIKDLKRDDPIHSCVLESENEDGFVVLSLRKASQEKAWRRFLDAHEKGEPIEVTPNEANKGGLLLEIDGIKGFIPVSQLAPMHYPRVNGADANLILQKLKELVSVPLVVKIINLDKDHGKLILSEKAAFEEERRKSLKDLSSGAVVKGKISGVVKFGIFVAFDGLEGLVHISEIAWGHVKDPSDYGKVGDDVEVQVIGIEGDKISLSMKRLQSDPWTDVAKTFKVGDKITGEINRLAPFGAFIKLTDDINGLIHLSEIVDGDGNPVNDPGDVLTVKDDVEAMIIDINLEEHRIGLSLKALSKPAKVEKKEKVEEVVEEEEEKEEEKEAVES